MISGLDNSFIQRQDKKKTAKDIHINLNANLKSN
jgi:hypothetical protein